MTINEYQTEALRTAAGMNHPNNDEILLNGVMGLCGESGECVDMIKKYRFQGHELDKAHLAKELDEWRMFCDWILTLPYGSLLKEGVSNEQS